MNTTTHDKIVSLLPEQAETQAQYDEWVRRKVAKARADTRPSLSQEDAYERLDKALSEIESGRAVQHGLIDA